MDSADKSSNKAMAVAFKYACFQVFCIPTEEMAKDDPDAYSPEESTASVPQPTQNELKVILDNCKNLAEFAEVQAKYGKYIKADAMLKNYGNEVYKRLGGGKK
jgi:hypothetical protein